MHCIQGNFRHVFNFNFTWICSNDLRLLSLNKRPMGHIAHLRKQFKSLKTYDYIIKLIKKKTSWELIGASFEGCFLPSLEKIGSMFLEKRIFFILSMHFRYFVIISPWKRVGPFIWTNLNPFHPRMLGAILSMYFWYFVIISPWKMVGPLHMYKLKSPSSNDAFAKFGWNWPCGSGEEDF